MSPRFPFLAAAAGLLLGACAPDTQAPVRVMALVQTPSRTFEPGEVELKTVTDVTELQGTAARLVGGARIVVDPEDPLLNDGPLTDEQLRRAIVKDEGSSPKASYIEKGGVLWPADFDTWNMVTTYFNFERTVDYFQAMGVQRSLVESTLVYYFPELILTDVSSKPMTDNALYFSPVGGFAVLPFDVLQQIPLGMNLGVIGHEFSHRVFNALVYGNAAFPAPFLEWSGLLDSPTPELNILKSFDEGLADYHGHGVTCFFPSGCDTRFIESSIDVPVLGSTQTLADTRDIANPNHCLTAELRNLIVVSNVSAFSAKSNEYKVGTALATALYQAGARTGKQRALQEYVLQAYSDNTPGNPGLAQLIAQNLKTRENFTLGTAANVIAAHITDVDLKREVCNGLMDHLQLSLQELPACPASASGGTVCEDLPQ